jgi:hypothetical protein
MQFLTYNGNGPFTGAYMQDSVPTGVSYIEVSNADYADWVNLSYSNGAIVPTPGPTAAQQLAAAQTAQVAILTAAYQSATQQPVIYTSKGGVTKTYQADSGSIANLQAMLFAFQSTAAVPTGFYWVASDNTQVPFTYADMQGLAQAIGTPAAAAFQQLQTLKAQVNAATTAVAVQAVAW